MRFQTDQCRTAFRWCPSFELFAAGAAFNGVRANPVEIAPPSNAPFGRCLTILHFDLTRTFGGSGEAATEQPVPETGEHRGMPMPVFR
jgi:hypothetical protein